jgi:hypothetical protein
MTDVKRKTALARLIDDTRDRNEWHDPEIAQRATSRGYKLSTSDLSNYRVRGVKTIVPAKVIALAAGLQIPPYRVAVAMLEDLGIVVPLEVLTPEAAIHHDYTLAVKTRDFLLAMIERERS